MDEDGRLLTRAGRPPPAPVTRVVSIARVRVGRRHRRDMGDLAALAGSIRELGLLQPVGLAPDLTLVFGARRLAAARLAGLKRVEARVFAGLADAAAALAAERAENTCRKDMLPSELVSLGAAIEAVETEAASRRQGRPGSERSGKLPEHDRGDTRDKVAAALGWGGRTYEKAKEVAAAAAAEPARFGDLVGVMDTASVDAAHRELKARRDGPSYPRPRGFGPDASEAVTVVRGCLIDAAEHAYTRGRLGELMGRDHPDAAVRGRSLDLFQALMHALFPEEFGGPDDPEGVVPFSGPRRAGPDRLAAFAAAVTRTPRALPAAKPGGFPK